MSTIIVGGELKVHTYPDTFSDVVKAAREKTDITVAALAEKVDRTERYVYRLENEARSRATMSFSRLSANCQFRLI